MNSPVLVTAKELSAMLSVSVRTIWRMRDAGRLPAPITIGSCVRWQTATIEEWVAAGCPQVSRGRSHRNDAGRKARDGRYYDDDPGTGELDPPSRGYVYSKKDDPWYDPSDDMTL